MLSFRLDIFTRNLENEKNYLHSQSKILFSIKNNLIQSAIHTASLYGKILISYFIAQGWFLSDWSQDKQKNWMKQLLLSLLNVKHFLFQNKKKRIFPGEL